MPTLSRRNILAATAGGSLIAAAAKAQAQSFGNPNTPPTGAVNATNPASLTDPGPQNAGDCRPVPGGRVAAGNLHEQHAAVLGVV
jgi:oxalate decarboxylase